MSDIDTEKLADELRETQLREEAVHRAWLIGSFADPSKSIDRGPEPSDVDVYITRPKGDPDLGIGTRPGIEYVEVVDESGNSYGERPLHILYNSLMPRSEPGNEKPYAKPIPFGSGSTETS